MYHRGLRLTVGAGYGTGSVKFLSACGSTTSMRSAFPLETQKTARI
jgi:hypothetical protein